MAYLELKNIKKSFGKTEVLKGIDFSLNKGEVLTIIGSSGSGKTTLLRCINFLESPNDGSLVLDGETLFDMQNPIKMTDKEIREKRLNFGLVFQSFNLFPQYSVFKNLTLAPTLLLKEQLKKLKKTEKNKEKLKEWFNSEREIIRKNCLKLLEKVGLEEKSYAYPCELSGGQCQRVAIARALALNPKILCFDEPTSALDPELTGEVLKVIKSLKNKDTTMIIVTHEMDFAKKVSDKIIFMSNGVIAEEGAPKDIFENPKTNELKNFLSNLSNKDGE
ncbi:MAG: amino acid ABC transporter ATP-binding protein [Clostridia bacterium]|nr:amino acid ABC transporter ATP-binding protein [Clostridia bacterium]